MHRIDDPARQFHNPAIDILVEKVYLKELIQMIKLGFTDAFKKVEGMKKSVNFNNFIYKETVLDLTFEEQIDKNYENMEYEIEIKIESLKIQLDQIRDALKDKLKELKAKIW